MPGEVDLGLRNRGSTKKPGGVSGSGGASEEATGSCTKYDSQVQTRLYLWTIEIGTNWGP